MLAHPAFYAEFKGRLVELHDEIQQVLEIVETAGAKGLIRRNELGRLNIGALSAAARQLIKKHRERQVVRAALDKGAPPAPGENGLSLDVLTAAMGKTSRGK